jgi:outer membrane protein OmpA-like peptidoglycan-associated protein
MTESERVRRVSGPVVRLAPLWLWGAGALALAGEPPPKVVDSQTIVRSLRPAPASMTRGLVVEQRSETGAGGGGGSQQINLDIRFANDSDQLTTAANAQLAQLGSALKTQELAGARFLIAGHTSASGTPDHNRRLSEARARAVRSYLMQHFAIPADRIEATGFGSSRPLAQFPANATRQRRVEISTLPP